MEGVTPALHGESGSVNSLRGSPHTGMGAGEVIDASGPTLERMQWHILSLQAFGQWRVAVLRTRANLAVQVCGKVLPTKTTVLKSKVLEVSDKRNCLGTARRR